MPSVHATVPLLVAIAGCIEPDPGYASQTGGGASDGTPSGTGGSSGTGPSSGTGDSTGPTTGMTSGPGSTGPATATTGGGSAATTTTGTGGGTTATTGTGGDTTGGPGFGHILFATSTIHAGGLGGLGAADAICQGLADAAGLPGTFVALMSTSTVDARDRTVITGPVRNTLGELLAGGAADLWDGMLDTPVAYDESGVQASGSVTWTGSTIAGVSSGANCLDWTSSVNDDFGTPGALTSSSAMWFEGTDDRCFKVKSLFCIGP